MKRCPRPLCARSAQRSRQPRYTLIEMFARPRGWPGLVEFVQVFTGTGVFTAAGRKAWATRRARAAQLALPLLPAQQPLFPPPRRPR